MYACNDCAVNLAAVATFACERHLTGGILVLEVHNIPHHELPRRRRQKEVQRCEITSFDTCYNRSEPPLFAQAKNMDMKTAATPSRLLNRSSPLLSSGSEKWYAARVTV